MAHKGAIAGFGQVAELAHIPAFAADPGFSIVAVADERPERLKKARELLPEAKTYSSLDELLARETSIDFVDIATPPFLHAGQVRAALSRGRHVLCEKPLTLDLAELRAIEAAAADADRTVFTVDNWKHAPLFVKLWGLLDSGALGELSHAELHVLRDKPSSGGSWRTDPAQAGGGILVDHGWHNLYLLRRLLGDAPVSARARLSGGPAEDEAAVFLEWPASTAFLRLSWRASRRANRGLVCGRKAEVELEDDHLLLRRDGKEERFDFSQKLSQGSAHPEWFASMLQDFRGEVEGPGRGDNLREAAFCVRTLDRIYQGAGAAFSDR